MRLVRSAPGAALVFLLATATAGAAQAGDRPGTDRTTDRPGTDPTTFAAAAADAGSAPTVAGLPSLVLDAHRAGGLEARENSLSGIEHALDSGVVDVVDLDVRRLGDGALGVMHDATVDRVTTSTGATSAYTRGEWRDLRLDIGSWLVPQPQPEPEAPPTLGEVLQRFGHRTVFTVEVKEGLLDEVARLLRREDRTDSVLVNTNDPDVARAVHDLGLHAHLWRTPTQMRTDDPGDWAGWLDVVDVDVRARRADVEEFVASGVPRVWAHTVTTRAERDRALRLGADGIVTDDPRYLTGLTDRHPVSPTVVTLRRAPSTVQVSDRTEARVVVSSQSGPVLPEAEVVLRSGGVTGRTTARPAPGVSTLRVSAVGAEKGRTRVRFAVAADRAGERRWPAAGTSVRLRVAGEDLQLLPVLSTDSRVLEVGVRLLDSAARDYTGPGAERGTGVRSTADLRDAGLRLQVLHDDEVVHRQRLDGVDTGAVGDGAGRVVFDPFEAEQRGRYTVRVTQRGPVYRRVVVQERVRLR